MTYREAEADAVRRMPDLTAAPSEAVVQATGTDPAAVAEDGDDNPNRAQRARNISVRKPSYPFSSAKDGDAPTYTPKHLSLQEKSLELSRKSTSRGRSSMAEQRFCN